jgi:hypothetical protein
MEMLKDDIGESGKNLMQLIFAGKESLPGTSLENREFLIYLQRECSTRKQNRAGSLPLRIHGGVRIPYIIREYPPEANWSRERDPPREPVTKAFLHKMSPSRRPARNDKRNTDHRCPVHIQREPCYPVI